MTFRLITNIDGASIAGLDIKLHCNAIVLSPGGKVDGYLNHTALPTFGYQLKCESLDYELEVAKFGHRNVLTFKDGTVLTLQLHPGISQADVHDYDDKDALEETLPIKVEESWPYPFMDFPIQLSREERKRLLYKRA